jgi:Predicted ATPase (AAA+ superfamily)
MSTGGLPSFQRPVYQTVFERAREERGVIQVLAGPRQVGKTTVIRQVLAAVRVPTRYATADEVAGYDREWIRAQWEAARADARESDAILVLDEVQKIPGWSDTVKFLWDEDTFSGSRLKVFILGSAPLLVGRGLSESLAGRFEVIRVPHWSFAEMHAAFDFDLDRFLYYGGYPARARDVDDEPRWASYIRDSLVETTISRDVLLLSPVTKPALLRNLFRLACAYSGQVLSYNKMLGQLQDAGNGTTLAHYVELLSGAGMVSGLPKYSGSQVRRKASSPKLLVHNTALMSAMRGTSFAAARNDPGVWGRTVETAVGAHLLNSGYAPGYWRERNREVDFVVETPTGVTAFEVTSGRRKDSLPGIADFVARYPGARTLLVGGQGIPLAEFLGESPERWLR